MARRGMQWRQYVPMSTRGAAAARAGNAAAARGETWTAVTPVQRGRRIATTVWGAAWCSNLERYHDYANRLPRGRTYVRNGSVVHLEITPGSVVARVQGSELYRVEITIDVVAAPRWAAIAAACAADIGSLVELLEGRLSASVMAVMTAPGTGLFPEPREIKLSCSCPDWATMCKHVAAVMYGIGVRLDRAPALLFALRGVDPSALVTVADSRRIVGDGFTDVLDAEDLASVFGIDLADGLDAPIVVTKPAARAKPAAKSTTKKAAKKAKLATKASKRATKTAVTRRA